MSADALLYSLKELRCPCMCGGEGELTFRVCPTCGTLHFVCGEIDTLMNLDTREEMTCCAGCGLGYACQFLPASLDEITRAGFRQDDLDGWPL